MRRYCSIRKNGDTVYTEGFVESVGGAIVESGMETVGMVIEGYDKRVSGGFVRILCCDGVNGGFVLSVVIVC